MRRSILRLIACAASTVLALFLGEAMVRGLKLAPQVRPIWIHAEDAAYKRSDNPILS